MFSVAPPETIANILWRDPKAAAEVTGPMKVTAQDLLELGLIDRVVQEPVGGAHNDPAGAAEYLGEALRQELAALRGVPVDTLLERRYEKYRRIGTFIETPVLAGL